MADEYGNFFAKMISDLPCQFRGKVRIEGLISALSHQLNDVKELYARLNDERSLMTAKGKQLDGIGNIAVLTREEATQLALNSATFTQMTDEIYRLYLLQKIMANMTNCTYRDLYNAMVILWGKTPIWYSESIDEPATITLTVPALSSFDETSTYLGLWEIRPAGVQLHFTATANETILINADFRPSAFIITHDKTGTKPRRAIVLEFDGIVLDENLSPSAFDIKHDMTSNELHSGTKPKRIVFLDIDGIAVKENLSNDSFVETHDRTGTKPREAVQIKSAGILIQGIGETDDFNVEPPATSEELRSGTHPSQIMQLDVDGIEINGTVGNTAYSQTHDRAGTKPSEAVVVGADGIMVEIAGESNDFTVKSEQTSEDLHTGTRPSQILLTGETAAKIYEKLNKEVLEIEYERSGTNPQPSVLGENDAAGIATSVKSSSFEVKYRKCGGNTKL